MVSGGVGGFADIRIAGPPMVRVWGGRCAFNEHGSIVPPKKAKVVGTDVGALAVCAFFYSRIFLTNTAGSSAIYDSAKNYDDIHFTSLLANCRTFSRGALAANRRGAGCGESGKRQRGREAGGLQKGGGRPRQVVRGEPDHRAGDRADLDGGLDEEGEGERCGGHG